MTPEHQAAVCPSRSHAGLLGHSPHRVLLGASLWLLATAVVFDLIDLATGTGAFNVPAYWLIAAGTVAGLMALPFGWIGWARLPAGATARQAAAADGAGHAVVIALFASSGLLRAPEAQVPAQALALALAGAAMAAVMAWRAGARLSSASDGVHDAIGLDAAGALHPGREGGTSMAERNPRAH